MNFIWMKKNIKKFGKKSKKFLRFLDTEKFMTTLLSNDPSILKMKNLSSSTCDDYYCLYSDLHLYRHSIFAYSS